MAGNLAAATAAYRVQCEIANYDDLQCTDYALALCGTGHSKDGLPILERACAKGITFCSYYALGLARAGHLEEAERAAARVPQPPRNDEIAYLLSGAYALIGRGG